MAEPVWSEYNDDTPSFYDALLAYYEIPATHPKVNDLYNFAWEHGHAGGLEDVAYWFGEAIDLIL